MRKKDLTDSWVVSGIVFTVVILPLAALISWWSGNWTEFQRNLPKISIAVFVLGLAIAAFDALTESMSNKFSAWARRTPHGRLLHSLSRAAAVVFIACAAMALPLIIADKFVGANTTALNNLFLTAIVPMSAAALFVLTVHYYRRYPLGVGEKWVSAASRHPIPQLDDLPPEVSAAVKAATEATNR